MPGFFPNQNLVGKPRALAQIYQRVFSVNLLTLITAPDIVEILSGACKKGSQPSRLPETFFMNVKVLNLSS